MSWTSDSNRMSEPNLERSNWRQRYYVVLLMGDVVCLLCGLRLVVCILLHRQMQSLVHEDWAKYLLAKSGVNPIRVISHQRATVALPGWLDKQHWSEMQARAEMVTRFPMGYELRYCEHFAGLRQAAKSESKGALWLWEVEGNNLLIWRQGPRPAVVISRNSCDIRDREPGLALH